MVQHDSNSGLQISVLFISVIPSWTCFGSWTYYPLLCIYWIHIILSNWHVIYLYLFSFPISFLMRWLLFLFLSNLSSFFKIIFMSSHWLLFSRKHDKNFKMIITEKDIKETNTFMLNFFQNCSLDLIQTFCVGNNVYSSLSLVHGSYPSTCM